MSKPFSASQPLLAALVARRANWPMVDGRRLLPRPVLLQSFTIRTLGRRAVSASAL
jgi:hypothetical protein